MFYCKYVCFEYFEGTSSNSLVSKEKIFFKMLTDISWPKVILRRLDLRVDCGSVEPLGRVPSPISDLQKPKENWKNLSPNFCTSITMQNLTNFSPKNFFIMMLHILELSHILKSHWKHYLKFHYLQTLKFIFIGRKSIKREGWYWNL